jgi:regulator of sigma E protease
MAYVVQASKGQDLNFKILRDGKEMDVVLNAVPTTSTYFVVDEVIGDAGKELQPGDIIAGIGSEQLYAVHEGKSSKSLFTHVQEAEGKSVELSVIRGEKQLDKRVSIRPDTESGQSLLLEGQSAAAAAATNYGLGIRVKTVEQYRLGIGLRMFRERVHVGVGASLAHAFAYPVRQTQAIAGGLYDIIRGRVKAEFAGPVGIATMAKEQFDTSWIAVVTFLMLLNVYLGLFNLLPLPALDGGRLVFLVYEMTTRRRANPKIEAMVHMVGIMALLLVMVLVTYKDIARLF